MRIMEWKVGADSPKPTSSENAGPVISFSAASTAPARSLIDGEPSICVFTDSTAATIADCSAGSTLLASTSFISGERRNCCSSASTSRSAGRNTTR